jgi:integrase
MARPPLVHETWGTVKATMIAQGRWVAKARYRDVDGRTRLIERAGRTKQKAEDAIRSALRDRLKPITEQELGPDTRLADLARVWWDEYSQASRSNGTLRRYKTVLDRYVIAQLGGWMIREVSVSKLDRFIKQTTKLNGYSNASIASVLLSGMFAMAARHDAIETNPMKSVAPVQEPEHEVVVFSLDDVAELREILARWDTSLDGAGRRRASDLADPVDMFLGTGCRPGEVFALMWEDVDFTILPITVTIHRTMAKSRDGKWTVQNKTKNGVGRRLFLPTFVGKMLLRRRVEAFSELVFPSTTATPRIPDNFRLQWHAALKGTRFEARVPKEFRATVATAIRDAAGLERAQHQLGHSNYSTTEQSYLPPVIEVADSTAILERFNVRAAP